MKNRLTNRAESGFVYCTQCCINQDKDCAEQNCFEAILDRLAAYEDSGLSPEEVQKLKMLLELRTEERDQLSHDVDMAYMNCEKLCEELEQYEQLAKAKADGRLVVLPCKEVYTKTGDTLYLIDGGEIIEVTHCGAEIGPSGEIYVVVAADAKIFQFRQPDPENDLDPTDWCTETKEVMLDDFGKTVFLTREEAEAALQKEAQHE